jgi:hypothetical protein
MRQAPALPMSRFTLRAFEVAMPPRPTSLPSPLSISFSDYWNAPRAACTLV